MRYGRFTNHEVVATGAPSTWVADYAVLQVEDGISSVGVVQPYIGRVLDPQSGEVLFEMSYPNWSRAYGGIHAWYAMKMGEE
jgi:hypothetical protein